MEGPDVRRPVPEFSIYVFSATNFSRRRMRSPSGSSGRSPGPFPDFEELRSAWTQMDRLAEGPAGIVYARIFFRFATVARTRFRAAGGMPRSAP